MQGLAGKPRPAAMPLWAKTSWRTAWARAFGFSERLFSALRNADYRPVAVIRPAATSDSNAAGAAVRKFVVSAQFAWVTLARQRKVDELIDKFRARNGPKSVMQPKRRKMLVFAPSFVFDI